MVKLRGLVVGTAIVGASSDILHATIILNFRREFELLFVHFFFLLLYIFFNEQLIFHQSKKFAYFARLLEIYNDDKKLF